MKLPKVHCIRIPRPCGCSTPIAAIFTDNPADSIAIESHTRIVNQHCSGRTRGSSQVRRWLTCRAWIKKYTHNRNRGVLRQHIVERCVELKEQEPRIPELFLL